MRLIRAGLIKDHEVLIVRNRQEESKVKKKKKEDGNMWLRPCLHREGTKEGESYNEKKKKKNNENLKGYRRHQYIY